MTTLTKQFSFKNVDIALAAGGDARDGDTSVTIGGVSGEVRSAFLYWGELNFSGSSDTQITFAGNAVSGTRLGTSLDTCWDSDHSIGYFADVTRLVGQDPNGTYSIEGMGRGGQGATLVVLYNDEDGTNDRDVVIYSGNDSTNIRTNPGQVTTMNLGSFEHAAGEDVRMTLNVGDGQSFVDGDLQVNGNTIGSNQFSGSAGALWDMNSYQIENLLTNGENTITVTNVSDDDCLQFVSVILDSPAASAKMFLDFDTAIPRDYYIVALNAANEPARSTYNTRAGTEPLGVFTAAQKTALVNSVQAIFDRSGVNIEVVSTRPTEGDFLSVRFSSSHIRYDRDGDGSFSRLLGQAYEGIDRYDQNKNGIVAVLMDGSDNQATLAEVVAHEAGHAYGLRHVNPVENSGTEVMDYDSRGDQEFYDKVADVKEPPTDGTGANRNLTHNPEYHLRRYVLGESDQQLRLEGIEPGTHDRTALNLILYRLGLADLTSPLESVSVLLLNQHAFEEGADVEDGPGIIVPIATNVGNGDQLTFSLPEGTEFQIIASTTDDTVIDAVLEVNPQGSDPFTVEASDSNPLAGDLVTGTDPANTTQIGSGNLEVTEVRTIMPVADLPDIGLSLESRIAAETGVTLDLVVSRTGDTVNPLTVNLSSDDTSELDIQGQVEIPAGQSSVTIQVTTLDDFLADGAIRATLTGQANGYDDGTTTIIVMDDETGQVGQAGDAFDNTLTGTAGNDALAGLGGNDLLLGAAGNDALFGGWGLDTLYGGIDDDLLMGDGGNDLLGGASGNDTMHGGDGQDALWGSVGDDQLMGDAGNDTLGGFSGNDSLDGGTGDDELWGAADNDTLSGGEGNDTLGGSVGNDSIDGGVDDDELWGADGSDTLDGGSGEDQVGAGTGDDTARGGDGNDSVFGGLGNDLVEGGAGNDSVFGAGGDDTVDGGAGNDTLFAGPGADVIIFSTGVDRLEFFSAVEDRIDLSGVSAITDFSDLITNHLSEVAGNAIIDDGLGNTLTIIGVGQGDLGSEDFIF